MVIVKNDNFADERWSSTSAMRVVEEYSGDHRSTSPDQMQRDAGEDKAGQTANITPKTKQEQQDSKAFGIRALSLSLSAFS